MTVELSLSLGTTDTRLQRIGQLVIAGWTGRDPKALERHIAELEALDVKRPSTIPTFYRVSASRATTTRCIQVTGNDSSGEVEFVLLQSAGKLWVGAGSDHTDRAVETYNVTVSKQMCEKPLAPSFWEYAEVEPHWDRLTLRSYIEENGERVLYQAGSVEALLEPLTLINKYAGRSRLTDGCMMFCGTLAANGGVRSSELFEFELEDPVLGRTISHSYTLECLPSVE